MRVILFGAFVLALAAPTRAQSPEMAAACAQAAETARTVMGARQNGVPAEKMMEPVLAMRDGPAKDTVKRMTLDAYAQTRWHSAESKRRAVEDFGNTWYMNCMVGDPSGRTP